LARLTGTCQLTKRSEGLPKYLAPRQQRRTRHAQREAAEAAPEQAATVFAIEALGLVDHLDFLDRCATPAGDNRQAPTANNRQAAASAKWFLSTTDRCAAPYFDPGDLHCEDREAFGWTSPGCFYGAETDRPSATEAVGAA
jgi:hypothetical protein